MKYYIWHFGVKIYWILKVLQNAIQNTHSRTGIDMGLSGVDIKYLGGSVPRAPPLPTAMEHRMAVWRFEIYLLG